MDRPDNLKVGDKFVLRRGAIGLPSGVTLTLYVDDGSSCPKFSYESDSYVNDLGVRDIPLCYVHFHSLEPYTEQEDQQVDLSKYQPDPNRLEVGKFYEFSDNGDGWAIGMLEAVGDGILPYVTIGGVRWGGIREVSPDSLGKIAPEPLVEGQAYMFDYKGISKNGADEVGICHSTGLISLTGTFSRNECFNIRKLVPES